MWTGTTGNPPTFTESLFGGAHTVSVTCPSVCPVNVGDNDNDGCTYDSTTTFTIGVLCSPQSGGYLAGGATVTVNSCTTCFCEQYCMSVCGTDYSLPAYGDVCEVSGSPDDTAGIYGPCQYYGLGASTFESGGKLTIEHMVDDAVAVMDAVGWQAAHVVGHTLRHSMGGVIAQRLALKHRQRVRSLTLMCTVARGRDATRLTARAESPRLQARDGCVP